MVTLSSPDAAEPYNDATQGGIPGISDESGSATLQTTDIPLPSISATASHSTPKTRSTRAAVVQELMSSLNCHTRSRTKYCSCHCTCLPKSSPRLLTERGRTSVIGWLVFCTSSPMTSTRLLNARSGQHCNMCGMKKTLVRETKPRSHNRCSNPCSSSSNSNNNPCIIRAIRVAGSLPQIFGPNKFRVSRSQFGILKTRYGFSNKFPDNRFANRDLHNPLSLHQPGNRCLLHRQPASRCLPHLGHLPACRAIVWIYHSSQSLTSAVSRGFLLMRGYRN